jgi:uncharacterized protein (DUF305 family)
MKTTDPMTKLIAGRMKDALTALVVCAALLASACATRRTDHGDANASPTPSAAATIPPAATPTPVAAADAPYDLQFLDTMTAHHQQAVEMAEMAVDRAARPELKEMARRMMAAQRAEIAQMQGWREQWYAGSPQAVNHEMMRAGGGQQMDLGSMRAAAGEEFDRMFLSMMIPHHEGAVAMSRDAAEKAEHAEVKRFAQKLVADQQREIRQMRQWQAASGRGQATPSR